MKFKNFFFGIIIIVVSLSLILTNFSLFSNKETIKEDTVNILGNIINKNEIKDFIKFLKKNNFFYREYKSFDEKIVPVLKKNISFYIYLSKKSDNLLITNSELLLHIHTLKRFHDTNNNFSYDLYKSFLEKNMLTEYLFQSKLKFILKNNRFYDTFLYIFNDGVYEKKIKKILLFLDFKKYNNYLSKLSVFHFYINIKKKYINSIRSIEYYDFSTKNFIFNITVDSTYLEKLFKKRKFDKFYFKFVCYYINNIINSKKVYILHNKYFYNSYNFYYLHDDNFSFFCKKKKYLFLDRFIFYNSLFNFIYKKKALNFKFKIKSLFLYDGNFSINDSFLLKLFFVKPYTYEFFADKNKINLKKFDYIFFRNIFNNYDKKLINKVNIYFYTNLKNMHYLKSFLLFNNDKHFSYKIYYRYFSNFNFLYLLTNNNKTFTLSNYNYAIYFYKNKKFLEKVNFYDQYFLFRDFLYYY